MVNRSKITGTRFESDVVAYLAAHGFPFAERRALAGGLDKGDIINAKHVWECKATRDIDLAGGIEETKSEIANAGADYGFLIIKRRRKSTADAYAVMTLEQLCRLLQQVG